MKLNILPLVFQAALLISLATGSSSAQDIPDKPEPPRLVNDFAGILDQDQVNALEARLVAFNDSTSTQIAIVTVSSLEGYDKADFAQRLGEKWGIGRKGSNNGVVVLVKPKQPGSSGQAQVSPGYGLEGVLPDLACSKIVEGDMIPYFRNNDYYGGLNKAVGTIMSLARGEFTADQYLKRGNKIPVKSPVPVALIFIIFFILIAIFGRGSGNSSNRRNFGSNSVPFWVLLSMMNSGRGSHGGSWGGFSGGGGGGGGFGGFGGGSFGGGGAGGSW